MNDKEIAQMIKETIHRADLLMRPNIVFVNSKMKDELLKLKPDLEKEVVLQEYEGAEMGKAYVINREKLESWARPRLGVEDEIYRNR